MKPYMILFYLVLQGSLLFSLENFAPYLSKDRMFDPDTSHLSQKYSPENSDRDFVYYLMKTYAPTAYYTLYRIENTTNTLNMSRDFMIWAGDIRGRTSRYIQVIVHESTHAYIQLHNYKYPAVEKKAASIKGGTGLALSLIDQPGSNRLVYMTEIYTTREMAGLVPIKEGVTYDFYELYIKKGTLSYNGKELDIGSQVYGVYGLLDEFNAFFRGHEAGFALREWYLDREETLKSQKEIAALWIAFFDDVDMNITAYHEFMLYILTYLIYAEKHYPVIYENIIANSSFARAFLMVEEKYSTVLQDFFAFKKAKLLELDKQGITASEVGSKLTILGETLTTHYDRPAKLQEVLDQKEYKKMLDIIRAAAE